jgi:hypothetical protein
MECNRRAKTSLMLRIEGLSLQCDLVHRKRRLLPVAAIDTAFAVAALPGLCVASDCQCACSLCKSTMSRVRFLHEIPYSVRS